MADKSNGWAGVGIQVDTVHRTFSLETSLTAGEEAPLRLPSRDVWESYRNPFPCSLLRK